MYVGKNITRTDIAEIHEAIAKHHPAKTEAEQKHQKWHAIAAKLIRENDISPGPHSAATGTREFTFADGRNWLH